MSDAYPLTPAQIEAFRRDGYVHLPGFLSAREVEGIEAVYTRFLQREIPVAGKDFCDMSGDYGRPIEEFSIVNVILPRRYFPEWQGNVYERRAHATAERLCGPGLVLDYDQLLAKPPHKHDAVFHWHQDMAYWPQTPDPRTASFWLALDDSTEANGCMRFVPGSHLEAELRPHRPLHGDRDKSHTLAAELRDGDPLRLAEIRRGDVTVHCERVLHGSGGNSSPRWRRAYVVAFRSRATVARERELGFTHSHNDDVDVLRRVAAERK